MSQRDLRGGGLGVQFTGVLSAQAGLETIGLGGTSRSACSMLIKATRVKPNLSPDARGHGHLLQFMVSWGGSKMFNSGPQIFPAGTPSGRWLCGFLFSQPDFSLVSIMHFIGTPTVPGVPCKGQGRVGKCGGSVCAGARPRDPCFCSWNVPSMCPASQAPCLWELGAPGRKRPS